MDPQFIDDATVMAIAVEAANGRKPGISRDLSRADVIRILDAHDELVRRWQVARDQQWAAALLTAADEEREVLSIVARQVVARRSLVADWDAEDEKRQIAAVAAQVRTRRAAARARAAAEARAINRILPRGPQPSALIRELLFGLETRAALGGVVVTIAAAGGVVWLATAGVQQAYEVARARVTNTNEGTLAAAAARQLS